MSRDWEQYRDRYTQRPETFEAYRDVWKTNPSARMHFSSWAGFSQCASAEPKRRQGRAAQGQASGGPGDRRDRWALHPLVRPRALPISPCAAAYWWSAQMG